MSDTSDTAPAADSNAILDDGVSPANKAEELGKVLEDAGSGKEDMFEDCPDDILVDEVERLKVQLDATVAEKQSFARKFEEEREAFVREVGTLRTQLRGLYDEQPSVVSENGGAFEPASGENGEKDAVAEKDAPWKELIKECSGIVKKALEKQSQIEERVRELDGVVYAKDQEIEGLNANVKFLSEGHHEKDAYFDALANRMLASLSGVVGQQELSDDSIAGKLVNVENGTFMLIDNFSRMLSEIEHFRQCLPETGLDHSSHEVGGIFSAARNELLELRRKEADFVERLNHLEDDNRKLVEELDNQRAIAERVNAELGQTKMELEQEKTRFVNTREKLNIAVQKGKGLVQQRDSLKQTIAEKTSELEKCKIELQEKSSALEAAELSKEELIRSENSMASLQDALSQNNLILQKIEEMLSQTGLPEDLQTMDIVEKVGWLVDESAKLKEISTEFQSLKDAMYASGLPDVILSSSLESQINWLRESYSQANEEVLVLRDEITATKEVAHKNIDQLTESLSAESQAKEHLRDELDNITSEYNEIIKKEHQVSSEKSQIVRRLLDASGVLMDNEDVSQLFPDIAMLVDTCIDKLKEQSMQANKILQAELDSLTSKYNEVVEKDRQASSENAEMVKMLLDASGIVTDDEDLCQISSDIGTFIKNCIEKIKEQSSASIEQLTASLSAEMQAKEHLQIELDSLTSKYKEIVEKERQVSSEKDEMVKTLLGVSGLVIDNEDVTQLSSEISTFIDRCAHKIKEQSSGSVSADMQAMEVLQEELESITSKYKEIVEKEHRVSSENAEMVKSLADASGIVMDNDDVSQLSSGIGTFINTCIGKIKQQSSVSFEQLSASLSAEIQAKENLQIELDSLTLKYKEIVDKERQLSSEKAEMVKMLLDVSGLVIDNEDVPQLSSDIATLINKCAQKIKEQRNASHTSPSLDAELFETIQSNLYIRDQELMLCQNILEEEMLVQSEVDKLSEELRLVSQQIEALKEEKGFLQRDLERSEEKNAMIREKLSMAVKKGKGMFQERENLKLRVEEKNAEIEKLRLELQQEQSALSECRDTINSLSADTGCIPKLKADLVSMKEQRDQLEQFLLESNSMLQMVTKAIDAIVLPVNSVFEEPLQKVNWIAGHLSACLDAEAKAKQELGKVEEETSKLALKLEEAHSTVKSLETELSVAKNSLSQLAEEKREMEVDKVNLEKELQRAIEEAASQAGQFSEMSVAKKSLEEALSLAENNLSVLVSEKEAALVNRAAADTELGKLKEEVDIQTSKLTDANEIINSLETALSQVQANLSLLTEQNNDAQIGRSNLEAELKKLQEEARLQDNNLADASATIKSLEDALLKAGNDISVLETGMKNAEEEILTLSSKLNASVEELSGTNGSTENRSLELISHLDNLQVLMKDKTMLSIMKKCFEKKFERLKDMDLILKTIRDHCVSEGIELQRHQVPEEDSNVTKSFSDGLAIIVSVEMDGAEVNGADGDDIPSYLKTTVERLQLRDMVLAQNFERFSSFIDEFIETLLRNIQARSDEVAAMFEHMESVKQKANNLEKHTQEQEDTIAILENDLRSLVSACTDATRELQFEVTNKLLELGSVPELEKLRYNLPQELGAVDGETTETLERAIDGSKRGKIAGMLSVSCKNVHTLMRQFEITSEVAASTIENLQNKLEEARATSEKAIEERDLSQNRISKLEGDIEALESFCTDLTLKLEDYQGKVDRLTEREAELSSLHSSLSMKEQENEDSRLSASEVKSLFDKITKIEIPLPESEVGDLGTHNSIHVKKLFHVIDNFSHFQHQIKSLSCEKEELQSTLQTQFLEIKHLKEELESYVRYEQDTEKLKNDLSVVIYALEKVIDMAGGNDLVKDVKSAGVKGLVSVLEKQVIALLLESKNSKSKVQELGSMLVESQKVVDELSSKVNLLEVSAQGRVAQPEIVQERSIFEAPSLPNGSEISEIEDVGSRGSKTISPVPSAAHVRTMRSSADHLAIDVDPESTRLISTEETDEDKGHVFKSLNASGIIPRQGKLIADRIDGIWVSGGRSLMSRPRARLGVIAYWLVLHLWLLGVIIL